MKRSKGKRSVWQGALSMVVLTLALFGCTKDPISPDGPQGDKFQLHVVVPQSTVTRQSEMGSAQENRLHKIAVFVFDKTGKLETKMIIPDLNDPSVDKSHPQWIRKRILNLPIVGQFDPRNIYVVANWTPPTINESTYTETKLNAELTTIGTLDDLNASTQMFVMSGLIKGVTTSRNVKVDIARQVAKIRTSLTLPRTTQFNNPDVEWLTDQMTITPASVLNKSHIFAGQSTSYPSGAQIITSHSSYSFTDMNPAQIFPITTDMTWKRESIYTNESLPSAKPSGIDTSTFIVIHLPYKNHTTGVEEQDNYYKIYVGEQKTTDAPYCVLRNTIYDLTITIRGIGMPFNNLVAGVNIDDLLTVIPWEKDEIEVENPKEMYFAIDRTRVEFQSFIQTQKVFFKLYNIGLWEENKVVWTLHDKADDSILFSSSDVAPKTIYTLGINYILNHAKREGDIHASITMEKFREGEFPETKREFYFKVKNMRIPLVVVYDNGFIPSSVLSESFTSSVGSIQGWPAGRLPARGLQIAKRGDQRLPSGVAGAQDSMMRWKTTNTPTAGTEIELGKGWGSTNAMIATGADEHPAAKYCREMGPEWYLPSRDELLLIYNNKATLGSSYTFHPYAYRSSTESSSSTWGVLFENGNAYNVNKTNNLTVRCVREL